MTVTKSMKQARVKAVLDIFQGFPFIDCRILSRKHYRSNMLTSTQLQIKEEVAAQDAESRLMLKGFTKSWPFKFSFRDF